MDEIVFTFPDVESAALTLLSLQQMAAQIGSLQAGLQVSRGGGAEELGDLSAAVCSFATALEKEIAEGRKWLASASAKFEAADAALAASFSGERAVGPSGGQGY